MDRFEMYEDIMRRYRAGEFGEAHLTLGEILSQAGTSNLLREMNDEELSKVIASSSSGPLRAYLNRLRNSTRPV